MKLIIAGGRNYKDQFRLESTIDNIHSIAGKIMNDEIDKTICKKCGGTLEQKYDKWLFGRFLQCIICGRKLIIHKINNIT